MVRNLEETLARKLGVCQRVQETNPSFALCLDEPHCFQSIAVCVVGRVRGVHSIHLLARGRDILATRQRPDPVADHLIGCSDMVDDRAHGPAFRRARGLPVAVRCPSAQVQHVVNRSLVVDA